MIKLTGEYGEEAQEVLKDLHLGIDAGKNIITATHNFEIKLLAMDMLIMHINFKYEQHQDLTEFFMEISDELVRLREELSALEKGEIHVILEEKAAEKRGISWMLRHIKKVKKKIKEESDLDKAILQRVARVFQELTDKFSQVDHLFSVNLQKATVTEIKLELEEAEKELQHILEQLLGFFITYNKIFRKELERLGKR